MCILFLTVNNMLIISFLLELPFCCLLYTFFCIQSIYKYSLSLILYKIDLVLILCFEIICALASSSSIKTSARLICFVFSCIQFKRSCGLCSLFYPFSVSFWSLHCFDLFFCWGIYRHFILFILLSSKM